MSICASCRSKLRIRTNAKSRARRCIFGIIPIRPKWKVLFSVFINTNAAMHLYAHQLLRNNMKWHGVDWWLIIINIRWPIKCRVNVMMSFNVIVQLKFSSIFFTSFFRVCVCVASKWILFYCKLRRLSATQCTPQSYFFVFRTAPFNLSDDKKQTNTTSTWSIRNSAWHQPFDAVTLNVPITWSSSLP